VKALAVSGIIVWAASDEFVHTTFVPFVMVSVAGLKEYFSSFSTIFISAGFVDADGEIAGVASEVVAEVGVGVVELVEVLVDSPQAASIRTAIMASKEINQADRRRYQFREESIE
jgi:hypothetical protein